MKPVQKIAVYFFAAVAAVGFFVMLGAESSEHWRILLRWGCVAFIGGTIIGCFLSDPRKYYRHIYGWAAVVLVFVYVNFHRGGKLSKTLNLIRINVGGYVNLSRFIADSAYYDDVHMEDYN